LAGAMGSRRRPHDKHGRVPSVFIGSRSGRMSNRSDGRGSGGRTEFDLWY
jgi:hypothetical protein